MNAIISLPLPFDAWQTFGPCVKRFCDSMRQFPPGHDYELWAVCNWGMPTDEVREWFYGIKTVFFGYTENGCDLGGHQMTAEQCCVRDARTKDESFVIGMTSRCYAWKEGWLARMMEVRQQYGPGLYGCSASKDTGLHLCTRAFGLDASLWKAYPHRITSRKLGPFFEIGRDNPNGNLLNWAKAMLAKTMVVHWSDTFDLNKPEDVERYFTTPNRFRHGYQSAMLVHDYHTQLFQDGTPEERARLAKIGLGEVT